MARHKEFDREEVLQKAMEVFWSRGYEAASVQELVDQMGINRQSLYDTFGDKHRLFLQALDRYQQIESGRLFEVLERPGPVKKSIRHLFLVVVDRAMCDEEGRGCLMIKAVAELAGRCEATTEKTSRNVEATVNAFLRALRRAKRQGELSNDAEPLALARFLANSLQGLGLMAKTTTDRKTLEDVVRMTMSVLD